MLFDLNGTLAYVKDEITHNELSEYLFSRGYEVSPQQLGAAWSFVSFVDYPKHGYRSWHAYLSRVLWRLKVEVDKETLGEIIKLLKSRRALCQKRGAYGKERRIQDSCSNDNSLF